MPYLALIGKGGHTKFTVWSELWYFCIFRPTGAIVYIDRAKIWHTVLILHAKFGPDQ